ncbi:MAG: hypothetical protein M3P24_06190 [Gemmatimonadota bacterium]|nr:hypothetical protein [Gemmatimonadota bacterium]
MLALSSREEVLLYLESCLRGDYGPMVFLAAYKYVTEQAYGKAKQPIEVEAELAQELVVRIVKE